MTLGKFMELLDQLQEKYGASILDYRCGKTWDVGQAVCAHAYGPQWSKSAEFREDDNREDEETMPDRTARAILDMLETKPAWMIPNENESEEN